MTLISGGTPGWPLETDPTCIRCKTKRYRSTTCDYKFVNAFHVLLSYSRRCADFVHANLASLLYITTTTARPRAALLFVPGPRLIAISSPCLIISSHCSDSTLPMRPFQSRLPNRNARPARKHSCRDIHGLQLLEQELRGIGDMNLRNLSLVLAWPAFE